MGAWSIAAQAAGGDQVNFAPAMQDPRHRPVAPITASACQFTVPACGGEQSNRDSPEKWTPDMETGSRQGLFTFHNDEVRHAKVQGAGARGMK
jgi:hypothetical protein